MKGILDGWKKEREQTKESIRVMAEKAENDLNALKKQLDAANEKIKTLEK
jgi:hypothetical protein